MTSHQQRLGIIPFKKKSREQRLPTSFATDGKPRFFCFWGNIRQDETSGYRILMRFRDDNSSHDALMPFRFMRRMCIGTKITQRYPNYKIPDKPFHSVLFAPAEAKLITLQDCPDWIKQLCCYQGENDCMGEQPVFRFKHKDQMYYLPAMEFIRKCYIANALRCDDFIYPGRMETAISYKEQKGDQLVLHLLRRYRRAYITEGTAKFLARWYCNLAFRVSFNSVANETILLQQSRDNPLKFIPPNIEQMKLTCILESHQKRHWVQQIIDVKGIPVWAKEVVMYQGTKKSKFRIS